MRVENVDFLAEVLANDLYRFQQVGIVRDDNRDFIASGVGVMEQMSGEIDVRPLFLGLDHSCVSLRLTGNGSERHVHCMGEKMPIMNKRRQVMVALAMVAMFTNVFTGLDFFISFFCAENSIVKYLVG